MHLCFFLSGLLSCSAAAAAIRHWLLPRSHVCIPALSSSASLHVKTSVPSCAANKTTAPSLIWASVADPYLTTGVHQKESHQHRQPRLPRTIRQMKEHKQHVYLEPHVSMMWNRATGFLGPRLKWNSALPTHGPIGNTPGKGTEGHPITTYKRLRRRCCRRVKHRYQGSPPSISVCSAVLATNAALSMTTTSRRSFATPESVARDTIALYTPAIRGPIAASACISMVVPAKGCNKRRSALQKAWLQGSLHEESVTQPRETRMASRRLGALQESVPATQALVASYVSDSDSATRISVGRTWPEVGPLAREEPRTNSYTAAAAEGSVALGLADPAAVASLRWLAATTSWQDATLWAQRVIPGPASIPPGPLAIAEMLNEAPEVEPMAATARARRNGAAQAYACETKPPTCQYLAATAVRAAGARTARSADRQADKGSRPLHAHYNDRIDAVGPTATVEREETELEVWSLTASAASSTASAGNETEVPVCSLSALGSLAPSPTASAAISTWAAAPASARKRTTTAGTSEGCRMPDGGAACTESSAHSAAVAARAAAVRAFCRWQTAALRQFQRETPAASHVMTTLTPQLPGAAFGSQAEIVQAAKAKETSENARTDGAAGCEACNVPSACLSCPSAAWSTEESGEEEGLEGEERPQQWQRPSPAAILAVSPGSVKTSNATTAAGATTPTASTPGPIAPTAAATAVEAISKTSTAQEVEAAKVAVAQETNVKAPCEELQQELLTPRLRARMEKQKYKLIGSHSAVKLCRWTKKQLQGIGGCYKHTFYGIDSHRCMEATTSIVCSNRCVFCWRHHTHPASKTFRWKADPPEAILEASIAAHKAMIKSLKGMQGVTAAAYEEALQPRHCALSLIGEALMYPHINGFIELLHSKKISSFLVMNGQHPELLERVSPVTQLYVSVDASNETALKAIDRPLFSDFWERLLHSLDVLRERKERTVVRLTLIKDMNDEDVQGYGRLIQRGRPDFIEVKGVTFAGCSASFKLSLRNTPHMQETLQFARRILAALRQLGCSSVFPSPAVRASLACASGSDARPVTDTAAITHGRTEAPNYQLASLHEHTNSVLLADANKFCFVRPEAGGGHRISQCLHSARESAETLSQSTRSEENNGPSTTVASNPGALSSTLLDSTPSAVANRESSSMTGPMTNCTRSSRSRTCEDAKNNLKLDSARAEPLLEGQTVLATDSEGADAAQQDPKSGTDVWEWHTHIDFSRFFELDDAQRSAANYCARTPAWASPAAPLGGFDPQFDTARYLRQIAGRPAPAMSDTLLQQEARPVVSVQKSSVES